jgi:hypothetical protein
VITTLPPSLSSNIVNEVVSGIEGFVDNASSAVMDNILPDGDIGTSAPVSTPQMTIEGSTSSPAIPKADIIFDNIPCRIVLPNATMIRQCTDILQTLSSHGETVDEFEISSVYGVESFTDDVSYIGNLESLILDLVAKLVLRCGNKAVQQLRSAGKGGGEMMLYIGVVKIHYPRRGQVTSICKSCVVNSDIHLSNNASSQL